MLDPVGKRGELKKGNIVTVNLSLITTRNWCGVLFKSISLMSLLYTLI